MRKIFILIVALAFFVSYTAYADSAADITLAGITPLSNFYFLDQVGKSLQKIFSFGLDENLELLHDIASERAAEARIMAQEKGFLSDEYARALKRFSDVSQEIIEILRKAESEEKKSNADLMLRLLKALNANNAETVNKQVDELNQLAIKKQSLRENINEAIKVGDATILEAKLKELERVKKAYYISALWIRSARFSYDLLETEGIISELREYKQSESVQFQIEKIEQKKKELLEDTKISNVTAPADILKKIDDRLADARTAIKKGNLDDAKTSVQKARDNFKITAKKVAQLAQKQEEKQKSQAEKDAEPRPVVTPISPIYTPPTSTTDNPITFYPLTFFSTEVGKQFSYSFCQPALAGANDLCGASSFDPSGGQPPYYFQLGSGGGFPPFGITLNLNGILTGTPTTEGIRNFSVCAVDLAGRSVCNAIKFQVFPKLEEPKPEPPPYVPRQGCTPQSEIPQPPPGCSYEYLRCSEDTSWVWEYQFSCPEPTTPPPPLPPPPPSGPSCYNIFISCSNSCQGLPSYPTYEKESCLTTCNNNYANCTG